ncbi:G2/mitotic-specific cyclin [Coemansia javaensis]|uniref:G2/mitotic-specific cyclin n=1 Tax=Coemansia javaensis TaxID=2761396 RepID=A0A9W8HCV5_9FUNG|nr:G2/mitotic-specific cyclin [Coemansia javaensis]
MNAHTRATAQRMAPARDENAVADGKAPALKQTAALKPAASARPVLGSVSRTALNAQKPAARPAPAAKPCPASEPTATAPAQRMPARNHPRVPLAAVGARKPHVYRDPVRPQPAHRDAADAPAARPLRILRSSSVSNVAPAQPAKAPAQPAKPPPPAPAAAGIKRRASSAEPDQARAVRARVSYEAAPRGGEADATTTAAAPARPSSPRSDATAVGPHDAVLWSEPASAQSRSDSQATAVEDAGQPAPAVAQRKIARPRLAFSSMRSLSGSVALELPPAPRPPVKDWDDIDADDADDPQMVSEYIADIIDYMRELEPKIMPDELYMNKQTELTWDMRRVLMDWLVQIHYQLRMVPETLFLAVNLIDRFLSKRQVPMSKLQLVGLTGLLIACKYEEMTTPHIQDFAYLAGDCYSIEEIMNAEVFVLRVLDFDMSYPSPLTFLRRLSKVDNYNLQTRSMAKYLMEICLVDHRFMGYPPSHVAAASMCLARRILESGPWDANFRHYSGYTEAELEPCIALMIDHMARTPGDEFVFKKYLHRRFLRVSGLCHVWAVECLVAQQPMSPPIGLFAADARASNGVPS